MSNLIQIGMMLVKNDCQQCPVKMGDVTERDCAFPDCSSYVEEFDDIPSLQKRMTEFLEDGYHIHITDTIVLTRTNEQEQ